MVTKTTNGKQSKMLETLLEELRAIKSQLRKLLVLIPEESLKEYKNPDRIKESYLRALRVFPPR
jgi:vacuolar-type H+-ATPase subunit F/Vma7